jgi:hypothetical protein
MREILITIGSAFASKRKISMSNLTETLTIECTPEEWASPFVGNRMNEDDIKELIIFLKNTLKE